MTAIEMKGKRFSNLVVLETSGQNKCGQKRWKCKCDCGTVFETDGASIRAKRVKSCGCYSRFGGIKRLKNNEQYHPLYRVWIGMKSRCNNFNNNKSHLYSKKGITVCKRWRVFNNFVADMGPCPEGCSIDRINGNKGYSPSNCRWATPKEQANNMATNKLMTVGGQTKTLSQWSDIFGKKPNTVLYRLRRGWTAYDALHKPIQEKFTFWRKNY